VSEVVAPHLAGVGGMRHAVNPWPSRSRGPGIGPMVKTMNAKEQNGSFHSTELEDTILDGGRTPPGFGAVPPHGPSCKVTRTVAICDTQPVAAEGMRMLLEASPYLQYQQTLDSLAWALEMVRRQAPDLLVVDKTFGIKAILEWLRDVGHTDSRTRVVIWGAAITESEAVRFLQGGARGILRKTASVNEAMSCLLSVADGRNWMEESLFRDPTRSDRPLRHTLTAREQQVLELVEQGLRNKRIAQDLGITLGTVKIHLNHIFVKTGVRGRHGLALDGLKSRGPVLSAAMPAQSAF
jgi:DNA-binding NarL/FixJ family response regulator